MDIWKIFQKNNLCKQWVTHTGYNSSEKRFDTRSAHGRRLEEYNVVLSCGGSNVA
jgi:hypothetical protein